MAGESSFAHEPVLVREVVELFAPVPPGVLIDGTVGAGGHARVLLETYPQFDLLGLDQDDDALQAAAATLAPFGSRAQLRKMRFDHLSEVMQDEGIDDVSGVLFDLGVSSPQLDRAERGFSYRNDGPLDMRMDRSQALVGGHGRQRLRRDAPDRSDSQLQRRAVCPTHRACHRCGSAGAEHRATGRHRAQRNSCAGPSAGWASRRAARSKRCASR